MLFKRGLPGVLRHCPGLTLAYPDGPLKIYFLFHFASHASYCTFWHLNNLSCLNKTIRRHCEGF